MARRSDHSRSELSAMALEAAKELVEEEGLRGLTARRVAEKIGYTPGTLYNLFDDLDDLIVHANCRTLDALHEACADMPFDKDPEKDLRALAVRYILFTQQHPKLWNALFEHQLPDGRDLPDLYRDKVLRLLELVERALKPLFIEGQESERHLAARTLWSALHGYCSLAISGKLEKSVTVEALADNLITNFVTGLRVRSADL